MSISPIPFKTSFYDLLATVHILIEKDYDLNWPLESSVKEMVTYVLENEYALLVSDW